VRLLSYSFNKVVETNEEQFTCVISKLLTSICGRNL